MGPMAAAPTDTTTATSGDVLVRRRGKSKAANFRYEGPVAVIRLELDASDERTRRRLGRQWTAVFALRRVVQRDAQDRCRTIRVDHAEAARSASQAKHARAAQVAAMIVAWHGNSITVEDCRISTWARLWGKRIAVFSPGMLVSALQAECVATGGQFYRAGTRSTALSQHCLCGQRVDKTLDQRTHHCGHCGLRGDRDIVSAALASCVDLTDPHDPRTARVDYRLAHALRAGLASQQ